MNHGYSLHYLQFHIYPIASTTSCITEQFLSQQDVESQAMMISQIKKRDSTQRMFPGMYFSCNGLLTKWIIGGEPEKNEQPFPELQLWRTTDATNYFKANFSRISTVPSNILDMNVYEYVLDPPLEVQNGDVFGLYKPKEDDSVLNIFLQEHSGPFAYGEQKDANAALSGIMVDPTMPLGQNDYPMVSVVISVPSKLLVLVFEHPVMAKLLCMCVERGVKRMYGTCRGCMVHVEDVWYM